jgi:deoxyribodipyrimidine photolyase-related protein
MSNMKVSLIYPHQLFYDHPALDHQAEVYLIEDPLFFTQYAFHKKKLILHRASMKAYEQYLQGHGYRVVYIEYSEDCAQTTKLLEFLAQKGVKHLLCCELADYLLKRRLERYSKRNNLKIEYLPSPSFMTDEAEINSYFKNDKSFFLTSFYTYKRKKHEILLTSNQQPIGGKWTFDTENRKKMPKGTWVPPLPNIVQSSYVAEAVEYVQSNFLANPGSAKDFRYPISFGDAQIWLEDFCLQRLELFGPYQDAMAKKENFLFHSVLSPMINIGILTPHQVVSTIIEMGMRENYPMNSIEGFVRQIIGWREYIRAVYEMKGSEERQCNFWNHEGELSDNYYTGNFGIQPMDDVLTRVLEHGYAHHIDRLMVLGNFMLITEVHPSLVYQWFMEMFVDAYDWVMVPNVYGMSQFADGGLMSTKPYFSGSNYILKMSNYEKGAWCEIWDGLFWRFIYKHHAYFRSNPRLSMMAVTWDKMDDQKKKTHIKNAEQYLQK